MKTSTPRISKITPKNGGAEITILAAPKERDKDFINAVISHDDEEIVGFVVLSWGTDLGYSLSWRNDKESPLALTTIPTFFQSVLEQSITKTRTLEEI